MSARLVARQTLHNSGWPTSEQLSEIWKGYAWGNSDVQGALVPANISTSHICREHGGQAWINTTVADIVPYTVYFCQVPEHSMVFNVTRAYAEAEIHVPSDSGGSPHGAGSKRTSFSARATICMALCAVLTAL